MTNPHPNTSASLFGGAIGILVVAVANRATGLDLSPEEAAAVSTVLGGAILLAGRFGPFKS